MLIEDSHVNLTVGGKHCRSSQDGKNHWVHAALKNLQLSDQHRVIYNSRKIHCNADLCCRAVLFIWSHFQEQVVVALVAILC